MSRYRRRIDIVADILRAAEKGSVKKTRIMHSARLSYRLLENYLNYIVKIGFMQSNGGSYELTDKGRVFLETYKRLQSSYSKLRRDLDRLSFERRILEEMCMLDITLEA